MAGGCEMLASSAAPHRIGFSRADVRRAHGRSTLSDLAHRTQPAVHLDFNVRVLRCYYAYGAPGTDRYPPFRPRMCQTTRPILTVTAATGYPGAALIKRWLLRSPSDDHWGSEQQNQDGITTSTPALGHPLSDSRDSKTHLLEGRESS